MTPTCLGGGEPLVRDMSGERNALVKNFGSLSAYQAHVNAENGSLGTISAYQHRTFGEYGVPPYGRSDMNPSLPSIRP